MNVQGIPWELRWSLSALSKKYASLIVAFRITPACTNPVELLPERVRLLGFSAVLD